MCENSSSLQLQQERSKISWTCALSNYLSPTSTRAVRSNDSKNLFNILVRFSHSRLSTIKISNIKKKSLINIQLWLDFSEWLSKGVKLTTTTNSNENERHETKINLNLTWKKSFVLWHLIHGFPLWLSLTLIQFFFSGFYL